MFGFLLGAGGFFMELVDFSLIFHGTGEIFLDFPLAFVELGDFSLIFH